MRRRNLLIGLLLLCFLFVFSNSVFAFSSIVAYGDSLTDDGSNFGLEVPDGFGRYTDGDLWVETLAGYTGSFLIDVAYAGATTGYDNPEAGLPITGLQWQLETWQPYFSHYLDSNNTLYTVWAGANDFFAGRDFVAASTNIGIALESLALQGATNILVPNLPDLGYTPAFYNNVGPVPSAIASGWTIGFNSALSATLSNFELNHSDVNLYFLDIYALFADLIEIDENGNIINVEEWLSLFWDPVHPSSIGHNLIADAAYDSMQPVPEPSTFILLGISLAGLAGVSRKKFTKKS